MQRQLGGSRAESRREQCARVCTLLHICRELLLTGMCVHSTILCHLLVLVSEQTCV